MRNKVAGASKKFHTWLGMIADQTPTKRSSTGHKGVYRLKRKDGKVAYQARISVNGKEISCGCTDTLEEAVKLREDAVNRVYRPIIEKATQRAWFDVSDK